MSDPKETIAQQLNRLWDECQQEIEAQKQQLSEPELKEALQSEGWIQLRDPNLN